MTAVMRASALLSLPLLGILAGVAEPLIDAVGPEWRRAALPLQVLTIMGGARALSMLIGPMLQALGRARLLAVVAWVSAALSASAFVAAGLLVRDSPISRQVVAISWSRAALYAVVFLALSLAVIRAVARVPLAAVLAANLPSLLAGCAAAGTGIAVNAALGASAQGLVLLAIAGAASSAVAGLTLYAVDPKVRQVVGRQLAVRGWGGFATAVHAAQADRTLLEKIIRS
jgi:O-antigen/teichoic acid export membrane protein